MKTVYTKLSKILSILLVAWQVPMMLIWKLTYDVVNMYSQEFVVYPDGGYALEFRSELLVKALMQHATVILALLLCLVLPILGLIFTLRRKGKISIAGICFFSVATLACIWLILVFAEPMLLGDQLQRYELCEFMFYQYDFFGKQMSFTFMQAYFPLLQKIKFVIMSCFVIIGGGLVALGISQVVSRRKQDQVLPSVDQAEAAGPKV